MARVLLVDIKRASFRNEMFMDGKNGFAIQTYKCVDFPRLTKCWWRENENDEGGETYAVDGHECLTEEEVVARLNEPAPDDEDPPPDFPLTKFRLLEACIRELVAAHDANFPARWKLAVNKAAKLMRECGFEPLDIPAPEPAP